MEKNRNEIDLIELFFKFYLILKKYIWILLIPLAVGIIFTIIKFYTKSPVYSSSMIVKAQPDEDFMYAITLKEFQNKYDKNPVEVIEKIIKEASDYRSNGNIDILAKRMNLPVEKARQILSLSTSYRYEKGEAYSNLITINVKTANAELFKDLNAGIINYINNNPYIKNKNHSDSIQLSNIISKIDYKIKELDSIQKQLLNKGIYQSNITIVGEYSMFAETVQLTALKEKLNIHLKDLNRVQVVEEFYIPGSEDKSFKRDLIINEIICLLLGLVIILFIVINKKANSYKTSLNL
jgi:hypothetical protein